MNQRFMANCRKRLCRRAKTILSDFLAFFCRLQLIMKLMEWESHYCEFSSAAIGFINDPLGDRTRIHLAISLEDDKYEHSVPVLQRTVQPWIQVKIKQQSKPMSCNAVGIIADRVNLCFPDFQVSLPLTESSAAANAPFHLLASIIWTRLCCTQLEHAERKRFIKWPAINSKSFFRCTALPRWYLSWLWVSQRFSFLPLLIYMDF